MDMTDDEIYHNLLNNIPVADVDDDKLAEITYQLLCEGNHIKIICRWKKLINICIKNNNIHLLNNEIYIKVLLEQYWLINTQNYDDVFAVIISSPNKNKYMYNMLQMILLHDNNNTDRWFDLFFDTFRNDLDFFTLYSLAQISQNYDILERVIIENIRPCTQSLKYIINNNDYRTLELFAKHNIDINFTSDNKKMINILNTLGMTTETLFVIYEKN
jgi:hypothetical protein